MTAEIQQLYLIRKGGVHGAMQDLLSRGAVLALNELRGDALPVPSAEQPAPGPTSDILAGCSEQELADVSALLELLRTDPDLVPAVRRILNPYRENHGTNKTEAASGGDQGNADRKSVG